MLNFEVRGLLLLHLLKLNFKARGLLLLHLLKLSFEARDLLLAALRFRLHLLLQKFL
jgi:hypothetical protein